jgi:hypothetical protein
MEVIMVHLDHGNGQFTFLGLYSTLDAALYDNELDIRDLEPVTEDSYAVLGEEDYFISRVPVKEWKP